MKTWFINNREAFDDRSPSENVWNRIDRALGPVQRRAWTGIIWKAAAIIFFGMSCYLWGANQYGPQIQADKEHFRSEEAYYLKEIREKKELIYALSGQPSLPDPATDLDLQRLDAMYEVLKEEYKKNPSKSVKEALLLNLLIRTDILNDEITKIEEGELGDSEI